MILHRLPPHGLRRFDRHNVVTQLGKIGCITPRTGTHIKYHTRRKGQQLQKPAVHLFKADGFVEACHYFSILVIPGVIGQKIAPFQKTRSELAIGSSYSIIFYPYTACSFASSARTAARSSAGSNTSTWLP